jgi:hypothetical protein
MKVPKGAAYDEARADRIVRFCARYLKHMKGRWAGQPFVLEDWQEQEIIRPLFGTVDPKTGRRWYREALIGLPRLARMGSQNSPPLPLSISSSLMGSSGRRSTP